VIRLTPGQIAHAAGGRLVAGFAPPEHSADVPVRAVIDSREVGAGDLFVGLPGASTDGGRFAAGAIAQGAWGVIVAAPHVADAVVAAEERGAHVIEADDPLAALGSLAHAWLQRLRGAGCRVIGITGSTGKTSTKDILSAMLSPVFRGRVHANRENFNTEIGLPLTVLEANVGVRALVLEMAMRGMGQIRELAQIAQPHVGVITNVGPVHLELVGTVERVAEAKAELIAELRGERAACVVPAGEEALHPHLRSDIKTITFAPWASDRQGGIDAVAGAAADVRALSVEHLDDGNVRVELVVGGRTATLEFNFSQEHNVNNALAAIGAAHALGIEPAALAEGARQVRFSGLRGEELQLSDGVLVVNDCYNANPVSMRAAIDDLAARADRRGARRMVAVLGDMRELGPDSARFHREIGGRASDAGVSLVVAVGEHSGDYALGFGGDTREAADAEAAAALVAGLIEPGDVVLVKASRGVGLERVTRALEGVT
jgi:UDP-N-acetylmuramoyl-tripeptide--D-alanyl-D-alanine ligase